MRAVTFSSCFSPGEMTEEIGSTVKMVFSRV